MTGALLKALNESDPTVREASAEAIGTSMKLMGEKALAPYVADVDPLKMVKIKECADKAVLVIKIPKVKAVRPTTAPVAAAPVKAGSTQARPVARPASSVGAKKTTAVRKEATVGKVNPISKSASAAKVLATEREMSPDEIEEMAAEALSPEMLSELADANWKTRLSAVESFVAALDDMEVKSGRSQVLIRIVCKKPGLKVI